MKKVCFVCLGNICRSPMAEFVMKKLDTEGSLFIESRATSSWEHGNPIHKGTQQILNQHGVDYDFSKTSQQISLDDFEFFDYIIGMDKQNILNLQEMSHHYYNDKIYPFNDQGVPDPWYTGDFDETYDLVTSGCNTWFKRITNEEYE